VLTDISEKISTNNLMKMQTVDLALLREGHREANKRILKPFVANARHQEKLCVYIF
jgi:hypothetical protein